jgi:hypothetical protein
MKNLLFLTLLLLTGGIAAQSDPLIGKKYSSISEFPGYEEYKRAGAGVLGPVNEEGNFVYAISSFRKGTDAILVLERMVQEPNNSHITFVILRTLTFTLGEDEVVDFYDCYIDGEATPGLIAVHKDFIDEENPSATMAWLADPLKERIEPFTALSRITCVPAPEEEPPMIFEPAATDALPPAEESLTKEEVKQLVEELASNPKARRQWKREQRRKRRSN